MKLIDLIAGARPNFMKIAPIIDALKKAQNKGSRLRYRLIHTGQHYDRNMSGSFFEQLGIPDPDINLEVGSGTQAEQTAGIMLGYERILLNQKSDLCIVVGDVTSTMACAITAQKLHVPVAHVEGGIRSGDWTMPEEINRMATDAVTNWFFTTSEFANENLRNSGVRNNRIFFVGNTMIDTLLKNLPRLQKPPVWDHAALNEKNYFVVTLHRPNNVDAEKNLKNLLEAIIHATRGLPVVFPVHPRTAKNLEKMGISKNGLFTTEPLSYLEFNFLVQNALAVVTDSGGITEETTVMGVPCITLRDTTERSETVTIGTNELVGTNPENLKPYLDRLFVGKWKKGSIPPLWDGKAAERIVDYLERLI
ncbi:MAG: UDP-N-acetylglucosamine 2-epimerase (non-hydrolyzing) [Desulfobacterales bacterium]|jgi:UDP-N-acetylglucosamine 2-epimerase (non-hydrolysing)|nr:UDP-N-acetylglucosamine 2-epimerase (non-hydrolyzing) [Desulfobacterales bacterium]